MRRVIDNSGVIRTHIPRIVQLLFLSVTAGICQPSVAGFLGGDAHSYPGPGLFRLCTVCAFSALARVVRVLADYWHAHPDLLGVVRTRCIRNGCRSGTACWAGGAPVSRESRPLDLFARGHTLFPKKANREDCRLTHKSAKGGISVRRRNWRGYASARLSDRFGGGGLVCGKMNEWHSPL